MKQSSSKRSQETSEAGPRRLVRCSPLRKKKIGSFTTRFTKLTLTRTTTTTPLLFLLLSYAIVCGIMSFDQVNAQSNGNQPSSPPATHPALNTFFVDSSGFTSVLNKAKETTIPAGQMKDAMDALQTKLAEVVNKAVVPAKKIAKSNQGNPDKIDCYVQGGTWKETAKDTCTAKCDPKTDADKANCDRQAYRFYLFLSFLNGTPVTPSPTTEAIPEPFVKVFKGDSPSGANAEIQRLYTALAGKV